MAASTTLSGGQSVLVYLTPAGGVGFDELDAASTPIAQSVQVAATSAAAVGVQALSNGGFTVEWYGGGVLTAQDFSAAGVATDQPYVYTQAPILAPLAFASAEDGATITLPSGDTVVGTVSNAAGSEHMVQVQQYANGAPVGPAFTDESGGISIYGQPVIGALASGGYAAAYGYISNFSSQLYVARFAGNGTQIGRDLVVNYTDGTAPAEAVSRYSISGLPDGGYVVSWLTYSETGSFGGANVYMAEYTATGQQVRAEPLGSATSATGQPPVIDALADGTYVISWQAASGLGRQAFTEAAPSLNLTAPLVPGETLVASGAAIALSGASGWTSAAVLSDHDLAIATGPGASGAGGATTYDAAGHATGSTVLSEFNGASPHVTALTGGFYEVTYSNTSDYEVYNAADQLVFQHTAYSPAGQGFTALTNGDYIVSRSDSNVLGLVDTSGNASWISLPADAPSGPAPTIEALQGGGFALTWAGSTHFDLFDAGGRQLAQGDLGASMSSFATAFVARSGGGFAEAWLSTDGGQDGLASALDVELFDASGHAIGGPVVVTQDLDPWHTQIELQAHADGSAALLWSQGGAIWTAEISASTSGAQTPSTVTGTAYATGIAGSLSDVQVVQLANDEVGLAFLQNGHAWAEIFDPSTGARQLADLGAATGDLSGVHALATANGGLVVSWHDGASTLGSVLSASGQASAPTVLSGDLIGVDANGHAVSVYDNGQGSPVVQHYALNDGLLWTAA